MAELSPGSSLTTETESLTVEGRLDNLFHRPLIIRIYSADNYEVDT